MQDPNTWAEYFTTYQADVNLLKNAMEATDERAARLEDDPGWRPWIRVLACRGVEKNTLVIVEAPGKVAAEVRHDRRRHRLGEGAAVRPHVIRWAVGSTGDDSNIFISAREGKGGAPARPHPRPVARPRLPSVPDASGPDGVRRRRARVTSRHDPGRTER